MGLQRARGGFDAQQCDSKKLKCQICSRPHDAREITALVRKSSPSLSRGHRLHPAVVMAQGRVYRNLPSIVVGRITEYHRVQSRIASWSAASTWSWCRRRAWIIRVQMQASFEPPPSASHAERGRLPQFARVTHECSFGFLANLRVVVRLLSVRDRQFLRCVASRISQNSRTSTAPL